MEEKMWYTSRTLWVNILTLVAMIATLTLKVDIPPEATVSGLALINMMLRKATNKKIDWKKVPSEDQD